MLSDVCHVIAVLERPRNGSTYIFLVDSIAANALHATNNFQIIPDFSLKDSMDQTVLGLALWTGTQQYSVLHGKDVIQLNLHSK